VPGRSTDSGLRNHLDPLPEVGIYFGNAYVMVNHNCVIAGAIGNSVITPLDNENHASRQGGPHAGFS